MRLLRGAAVEAQHGRRAGQIDGIEDVAVRREAVSRQGHLGQAVAGSSSMRSISASAGAGGARGLADPANTRKATSRRQLASGKPSANAAELATEAASGLG